ncbi:MAG: hypothetical protein E6J75_15665 [Deltaproteobacteria bacterium]|nr:MAG: hypothetical protein E6J75_15665 [Deltaproteobacteria bacterium]
MSRRFAVVALAALALAGPRSAAAVSNPCQNRIGASVLGYSKARMKAISACEDKRSKGTLPAATICRPQCSGGSTPQAPCRTDADCPGGGTCQPVTDPPTSARLSGIQSRFTNAIVRACPGSLPPIGPACDDSATNASTLAGCITAPLQDADVEPINIDTLTRTIYDSDAPIADVGLRKCQAAISRQARNYLGRRMKAIKKCEDKRVRALTPGPCPDATAEASMATARTKMDTGIRRFCSEAQLASTSPELKFGLPCESYKLVTYKRGPMNENTIPVQDRLIRCVTDASAGVVDRMMDIPYVDPETSEFTDGVAAGDGSPDGAIFWTRLPDSTAGAFLDVVLGADFTGPLVGGTPVAVSSNPGEDGTVKRSVTGLTPGTVYSYRFRQGIKTSRIGRLVTPPTPSSPAPVRLGWSGDSNAFFRPYTVLDEIRIPAVDAWLFIGDTIYGDDPRADGLDAMTLQDYYAKYRENREDASLRDIMAAAGTYVQWDDHEVRNDFAGASPIWTISPRVTNGNKAFRVYNPMRESTGDPKQLYRSFRWGSLAEFFLIDDRHYRSPKYTCCNTAAESGFVLNDDDTTCHTSGEAVSPSASCNTAMADSSRTILGAAQKAWLESGLMNSTATFKFIMNGPPITQLIFVPYDRWEAWPAERTEILDFITNNSLKNVVWLSTDLHGIVISPQRLDTATNSTHTTPEIVAGAIGMDPLFRELPPSILSFLPIIPSALPQVSEFDIDRFNVVTINVDPGAPAVARFDFLDRTGATIHSFSINAVP